MACRVWHESKINYIFVFEYDTRHHLDWRQLSEVSCNHLLSDTFCLQRTASLFLFFPSRLLYVVEFQAHRRQRRVHILPCYSYRDLIPPPGQPTASPLLPKSEVATLLHCKYIVPRTHPH